MVEQGKRSKEHWWNTFQKASHPSYATLVDPPSLEDIDTDAAQVRVKSLLMDDVLDTGGYREGSAPQQFEVAEGGFVLVLPSDASSANAQCVSPPWLCRVNRIWLLPGGDAAGSSSYLDVKGAQPEVQQWERRQIADGRVAAQHFHLQVTYFYRWPDLADAVEGSAPNTRRLARALTGLGVTQHARELDALLRRRGCGRTPPNHFGMRYVVFSNHETKDPGPEPGSDDEEEHEEDEAEDSPVPMESVMGPAQVLFLPSSAKLPYQPAPPPAASAAGETARKAAALPQALQTRLALRRRQLAPGFICNLFLAKVEGAGQQPRLFGLSEWADGSAGAALRGRPWVAGSRRQVQQLLADSQEHLRAAAPAAGGQQQPAGTSGAATAARATGARAAAAAAAAAASDGDDGEQFVDARSGSQHRSGEESGEHDVAVAGSSRQRRQRQQRQPAAGGPAAAVTGGAAAAAGREQQQQKRRRIVGLDSEDEEVEEEQQPQEACPDPPTPAALLAAEQQEEAEEEEGEEADDDSEDEGEDDEEVQNDSEVVQGVAEMEQLSSGTIGEEEEESKGEAEDGLGAAAAASDEEPAAVRGRVRPPKEQKLQQGQLAAAPAAAPAAAAAAAAASEGDGSGSRQQRRHGAATSRQHQHSKPLRGAAAAAGAAAGGSGVRNGSSDKRRRGPAHEAAAAAAGTLQKRKKR